MSDTPRTLRAYYHTFDPTGCDAIDAILEAVAMAGKAYHHTGQWDEADQHGPHGYWSLIQQRAQEAASAQPAAPARGPLTDLVARKNVIAVLEGMFDDLATKPTPRSAEAFGIQKGCRMALGTAIDRIKSIPGANDAPTFMGEPVVADIGAAAPAAQPDLREVVHDYLEAQDALDAGETSSLHPDWDTLRRNRRLTRNALDEALAAQPSAAPMQAGEDAKDAARYRWLRSDDIEVPQGQREICAVLFRLPFREDQSDVILHGPALDAAIDAAMSATLEHETATQENKT